MEGASLGRISWCITSMAAMPAVHEIMIRSMLVIVLKLLTMVTTNMVRMILTRNRTVTGHDSDDDDSGACCRVQSCQQALSNPKIQEVGGSWQFQTGEGPQFGMEANSHIGVLMSSCDY